MSKSQKAKSDGDLTPKNILSEEKPKEKTPYRTIGTVRMSKSGNAISIKLISENRFLHISKRDIELILDDEEHITVANVREYDNPLNGAKNA